MKIEKQTEVLFAFYLEEKMKENYSYPIDLDWTTEEMIAVVNALQAVEKAYEGKIKVKDFATTYTAFKEVVPSIGEEKRIGREFEQLTGYSLYRVVQEMKQKKENDWIQMPCKKMKRNGKN